MEQVSTESEVIKCIALSFVAEHINGKGVVGIIACLVRFVGASVNFVGEPSLFIRIFKHFVPRFVVSVILRLGIIEVRGERNICLKFV